MNSRRLLLPALGFLVGALFWWRSQSPKPAPASAPAISTTTPATLAPLPPPIGTPRRPSENSADPVSAALELNSPRFDVTHDLVLLNDVFTNWRLDSPRTGNPFGENSDITAALTGDNPLRLAYIPRSHPAINAAGELCDRWGTPFRFHALAGDRMELRSAGPDKKFGTPDDALLTPP